MGEKANKAFPGRKSVASLGFSTKISYHQFDAAID
jgi:hypothetical protein